jgi:hypothetical protein
MPVWYDMNNNQLMPPPPLPPPSLSQVKLLIGHLGKFNNYESKREVGEIKLRTEYKRKRKLYAC